MSVLKLTESRVKNQYETLLILQGSLFLEAEKLFTANLYHRIYLNQIQINFLS